MILFLLSLLHSKPEVIFQSDLLKYLFDNEAFLKQLESEAKLGKIKKVNPEIFYTLILSFVLFPISIDLVKRNVPSLSKHIIEEEL